MANKDIVKITMITNYWLILYYSFHYDMLPSFCNLFTFFATYCSPSLLKELCHQIYQNYSNSGNRHQVTQLGGGSHCLNNFDKREED